MSVLCVRGEQTLSLAAGNAPVLVGDGRLETVPFVSSPNCDARPPDVPVSLVVVHAISLPPEQFGGPAIERLFTNGLDPLAHPYFAQIAHLRVSAHFLIRRDGQTMQFVPTDRRAWHAGLSCWKGREQCNDFSVGIELEGSDLQPFELVQYRVLGVLIGSLARRYPITDIAAHSDIAPGRKTDPGPFFNWSHLIQILAGAAQGVGLPQASQD